MSTQQAAAALRLTVVAAVSGVPGNSLDEINSAIFPDGALFSVNSNKSLYRLDKSSAVTPIGLAIVAPNGGPGRFVFVDGPSSLVTTQVNGNVNLLNSAPFAEVINTWIALPAGSNFYSQSPAGLFSLDSNTGVLTYVGAPMLMRVELTATVSSAAVIQLLETAPSVNNGFIGTTTELYYSGSGNVSPTNANLGIELSSTLITPMAFGDTVRGMIRDNTGSNSISVTRLNMVVSPA